MGDFDLRDRTVRKQFSLLAADQAVSSLITLTLSVYSARNSSVRDFGIFAVAYALLWVLMGTSRSFVGEVNLIMGHDKLSSSERWRSYSATTSLSLGLAAAIIMFVACTLIAPADDGWISASFAAATPLVIFADAIRYISFAEEAAADALTLDLIWLAGALIAPPVFRLLGVPPMPAAILGWGFGAALGVGLALSRRPELRLSLDGFLSWSARRRAAGFQFVADFLAASGIGQAATILIPVVSTLGVAGGLRAGYVILGPLNVVSSALIVFLIPRLRVSLSATRTLPSPAPAVLAAFAIFCGLCASIILVVPDKFGEFLLGPSWRSGQAVAPLLIAAFFFITFAQVIVQVMRLRGSAGLVIQVRLFVSALQAASILTGAAYFGAIGAASGSALAALIALIPWWMAVVHCRRKFA